MTTDQGKRAAAAAAKVGDELVVTEGAHVYRAQVIKAGPAWLTMGVAGGKRVWKLRRDTRTDTNDGNKTYAHSPHWYTVQEWAEREALAAAWTTVREQGISVYHGSEWNERIAELAQRLTSPSPRGTVMDAEISSDAFRIIVCPVDLPGKYVATLGYFQLTEEARVALIEALGGVA